MRGSLPNDSFVTAFCPDTDGIDDVFDPSLGERQRAMSLADELLTEYCALNTHVGLDHDAGPIIFASLYMFLEPSQRPLAEAALARWLGELPEDFNGIGPFGGLGGFIAGLRAATIISKAIEPLHQAVCTKTVDWLSQVEWRSSDVVWCDYDFFTGPSGVILAGATKETSPAMFGPALSHLIAMCESPDMQAFRAGQEIDPRSAFNIGRINTGLGHGLAGVASALHHAVRVFGRQSACEAALRQVADWLVRETITDPRGLVTWPPVGADGGLQPDGFSQRQAWCYGTPGVAWTLWDISQTLGDQAMEALSLEAMRTFSNLFDADLYIDKGPPGESLSICHGVAGTLAVADAFWRHAKLKEAGTLRKDLFARLIDTSEDIRALQVKDMSMLSGAGGIVSVLLTVMGADRRWLQQIALSPPSTELQDK